MNWTSSNVSTLTLILLLPFGTSGCPKTSCGELNTAINVDNDVESAVDAICANIATSPQDQVVCQQVGKAEMTSVQSLQVIQKNYCTTDAGVVITAAQPKLSSRQDFKTYFEAVVSERDRVR
jgi:hypothetical protein